MRKLRIAMVCDLTPGQIGGSFISTLRFAELLNKLGHKAIILAARDSKQPIVKKYKNIQIYQFFSLPIPNLNRSYFMFFPRADDLKEIFLKEKIDVVHTMTGYYSCFLAMRVAKKLKIPIVAHSHSQPENIFLNLPKWMQGDWLNRITYRYIVWVYKKAEITLCPSKFAERALKRYDATLKTKVLSNGVDLSKFKELNSEKFIKKYKIDKSKQNLLFVGRLHPEKNVEVLIKAIPFVAKEYPKIKLNIVGAGYQEDYLKELVKKLKIGDYVSFLGRISDSDLIMAYNASDIFILPSLAELEGMVVLEAMACGKPIIIANSENSASVDFVKKNGFLFNPEDPEDLAVKILKIVKNKKLKEMMGRKSLSDVKNYDINKSISTLEKIYYSLI